MHYKVTWLLFFLTTLSGLTRPNKQPHPLGGPRKATEGPVLFAVKLLPHRGPLGVLLSELVVGGEQRRSP